nr:hypothetical protein Iba_chr05aCG15400 [Ipomoea batatas]
MAGSTSKAKATARFRWIYVKSRSQSRICRRRYQHLQPVAGLDLPCYCRHHQNEQPAAVTNEEKVGELLRRRPAGAASIVVHKSQDEADLKLQRGLRAADRRTIVAGLRTAAASRRSSKGRQRRCRNCCPVLRSRSEAQRTKLSHRPPLQVCTYVHQYSLALYVRSP